MAWTRYQIGIAVLLVVTGSINTIATKWADRTKSVGVDGTSREFNHPFLQAVGMFFGEFTCLIAYKVLFAYYTKSKKLDRDELPTSITGNQDFNPVIFLAPAMCDMTATSIMYIGLNLTYASTFQMLRGAVIIFTGFLSVAFLQRKLQKYQWAGIGVVLIGLIVVGASDMIFKKENDEEDHGTNSLITGNLLIIIAQVIAATQMVVEEKFVSKYNVAPLQAVGWEGLFGMTILGVLLIPMYYIPVGNMIFQNPGGQLEDAIDGFVQIGNSWQVCCGFIGTILSISFFNFAGISVTKELSATTRMVLDSVRTLFIWLFSLALSWQDFNALQPLGFIILVTGMCLYNDVVIRPFLIKKGCVKPSGSETDLVQVNDDEDRDKA